MPSIDRRALAQRLEEPRSGESGAQPRCRALNASSRALGGARPSAAAPAAHGADAPRPHVPPTMCVWSAKDQACDQMGRSCLGWAWAWQSCHVLASGGDRLRASPSGVEAASPRAWPSVTSARVLWHLRAARRLRAGGSSVAGESSSPAEWVQVWPMSIAVHV